MTTSNPTTYPLFSFMGSSSGQNQQSPTGLAQYLAQGQAGIDPGKVLQAASSPINYSAGQQLGNALSAQNFFGGTGSATGGTNALDPTSLSAVDVGGESNPMDIFSGGGDAGGLGDILGGSGDAAGGADAAGGIADIGAAGGSADAAGGGADALGSSGALEDAGTAVASICIICTALYKHGRISRPVLVGGQRYALSLPRTDYEGYLKWAAPIAGLIEKSALLAAISAPLFVPGYKEAAFRAGFYKESTWIGRRYLNTALRLSKFLGKEKANAPLTA